jgi:hypothetical protein
MIVARNPLITMHELRLGDQTRRLVRPPAVWTDKEKIGAIKSTT